jgi:choline kinase
MKAVILAAGMGSRLGEFTRDKPKTLLLVRGKPLIFHILGSLSTNGIEEVIIITGYEDEKIREEVRDGSAWGLKVRYVNNPRYDSTNNIYSLRLAEKEVASQGFLIVNSDVFFHPEILRRLLEAKNSGITLMVDVEKSLGEEEMKVVAREERITDIGKGLLPRDADGEYIGLARIDSEFTSIFFDAIKEVLRDQGAGVFYEEAFKRLIEKGFPIKYSTTGGYPWIEIDTPQDLRTAEADIAPEIEKGRVDL